MDKMKTYKWIDCITGKTFQIESSENGFNQVEKLEETFIKWAIGKIIKRVAK
jgi:hypothetical protein